MIIFNPRAFLIGDENLDIIKYHLRDINEQTSLISYSLYNIYTDLTVPFNLFQIKIKPLGSIF